VDRRLIVATRSGDPLVRVEIECGLDDLIMVITGLIFGYDRVIVTTIEGAVPQDDLLVPSGWTVSCECGEILHSASGEKEVLCPECKTLTAGRGMQKRVQAPSP
jgi:hypothetical protein